MLRDPVEMAPACHGEAVFLFDEALIQAAWQFQRSENMGKRSQSLQISGPPSIRKRTASFASQVERLFDGFRQRRKIIIFDDFVADTRAVYREVLDFLAVPDDGRLNFAKVRRSQVHRYPSVAVVLLSASFSRATRRLDQRAMQQRTKGILVTSGNTPKCRTHGGQIALDWNGIASLFCSRRRTSV